MVHVLKSCYYHSICPKNWHHGTPRNNTTLKTWYYHGTLLHMMVLNDYYIIYYIVLLFIIYIITILYRGIHDAFWHLKKSTCSIFLMFSVLQIHDTNNINVMKTIIPNDVVVVSQVKLLCVFSGVVHHSNSSHKIHDLLPCSVVQVIPALMSSISMNPLQPQLTAGSRLLCHALGICNRLQVTNVSFSWLTVDFLQGPSLWGQGHNGDGSPLVGLEPTGFQSPVQIFNH